MGGRTTYLSEAVTLLEGPSFILFLHFIRSKLTNIRGRGGEVGSSSVPPSGRWVNPYRSRSWRPGYYMRGQGSKGKAMAAGWDV